MEQTCWVVTDGRAGIENQALGLAEAIGRLTPLNIVRKHISVKAPYRWLPRQAWGDPFTKFAKGSETLLPVWPDLWIAAGRLSIPYTIAMRKKHPAMFTVQTQDPRAPADLFGAVVPPAHDDIKGDNVVTMVGAPNRLQEDDILADAHKLQTLLPNHDGPRVAALIGGRSKAHKLSAPRAKHIGEALARLARGGAYLMVTTSRRTGEVNERILREELSRLSNVFFWNGAPLETPEGPLENPYFGMLGLADHILVTADSTNMATDAAFTGEPVHILQVDGGSAKFEVFHARLESMGISRPFEDGKLNTWSYAPLRETETAAAKVLNLWRRHRQYGSQER
ncbi:MAG: mitochondrial fission ELM1 family protein [Pseudomonadota bacterium]